MEPDPTGRDDQTGHERPDRRSHRFWRAAGPPLRRYRVAVATLLLFAVAFIVVLALTPPSAPPERSPVLAATESTSATGGVVNDPIDPRYLTALRFGETSFWIQPWRAYLDTWPASRLLDSLGINFNVTPKESEDTARLLQDSGFKLARIEIGWDSLSYENPTKFVNEASIRKRLVALHEHGLRPLILLNSNSGLPCPAKKVDLEIASPAPAGVSTVTLSPASVGQVIIGKTGFDGSVFDPHKPKRKARGTIRTRRVLTTEQKQKLREEHRARARAGFTPLVVQGSPAILITKIGPHDVATLSRPLPAALAPSAYKGTTLLYAPFGSRRRPDGSPNPAFQATLRGWLDYVATVSREAQSIFGPGGYDLEIWNELSFGSQFLDGADYYSPAPENAKATLKEVTKALLSETVAYVRNPANGISPNVGVSNGFASQTPFPSGAFAPDGLTAYSKHLYAGVKSFPAEYSVKATPLDALGRRDTAGPPGSPGAFKPLFVPHYQSLFPEYFLTATQTETVVRDLAPLTTKIYKAPHGRYVSRPHQRPPQVWMTEYNLSTPGATPMDPNETTPATGSPAQPTPADEEHLHAKALLRSLVAMVSKGMTREYFFGAAHAGELNMINERFMSAVDADPTAYPGDRLGGETMTGFRNMLARFYGPGPGGLLRQLRLISIAQDGNHAQFSGDGTAVHPDLYDRDVLAVFPFQSSPTRYVIPVYVMTRDLLTLYDPSAPSTDITRFDLPNENFRIMLGNLPETSKRPSVNAYDPLRNTYTPARLISRQGNRAVFEIAATDYPRILTIDYTGK